MTDMDYIVNSYLESSAKLGKNVDSVFFSMVRLIRCKKLIPEREETKEDVRREELLYCV